MNRCGSRGALMGAIGLICVLYIAHFFCSGLGRSKASFAGEGQRRRRLLAVSEEIPNYIHHGAQEMMWGDHLLSYRISGIQNCTNTCNEMGVACAGFQYTNTAGNDKCTLAGRGYGLVPSTTTDFYRKKRSQEEKFTVYHGKFFPIHLVETLISAAVNGTLEDIRKMCSEDRSCAGFYTCSPPSTREELLKDFRILSSGEGVSENIDAAALQLEAIAAIESDQASAVNETTDAVCDAIREAHSLSRAEISLQTSSLAREVLSGRTFNAILLSSMPEPRAVVPTRASLTYSSFIDYPGITVYSREVFTHGGTALGAPCKFPFDFKGGTYWDVALDSSERPFCYTLKPGAWGFTDVYTQDSIGAQWEHGKWNDCSLECGGGVSLRTAVCRNTSDGNTLDGSFCGAVPKISEQCNTFSCADNCKVSEIKDRRPCDEYYHDEKSTYSSNTLRRSTCESKGCCWSPSRTVGFRCYRTLLDLNTPGCSVSYDAIDVNNPDFVNKTVTKCGNACCRGSTSGNGKECHYHVGFANPLLGSSDAEQCSELSSQVASRAVVDKIGWTWKGHDKVSEGCSFIWSFWSQTTLNCMSACRNSAGCDVISYNDQNYICRLSSCGLQRANVALRGMVNFDVYVWQNNIQRRWLVGSWSECVSSEEYPDVTSPGAESSLTECQMIKFRSARCVDETGTTLDDTQCYAFQLSKPETNQTCYGACNVNRTCEEIRGVTKDILGRRSAAGGGLIGESHASLRKCGTQIFDDGPHVSMTCTAHRCDTYKPTGCYIPSEPYGPNFYSRHRMADRKEYYYDASNTTIHNGVTFAKTESLCADKGMRMCTIDEIVMGIPRKYNYMKCIDSLYWSSTSCGEDNQGAFVGNMELWKRHTVMGHDRGNSHLKHCVNKTTTDFTMIYPVCCSEYKQNLDIPVGSTGWRNDETFVPNGEQDYYVNISKKIYNGQRIFPAGSWGNASQYKTIFEKEVEDQRLFLNLKNGMDGYCNHGDYGPSIRKSGKRIMPCKTYEGGCYLKGDGKLYNQGCGEASICAPGIGPKYGFMEGVNVCIPRYESNQISFTLSSEFVVGGVEADILFTERGTAELPDEALFKVLRGKRSGCTGAWDQSVEVAAEVTLAKQGEYLIRPEGFPLFKKHGFKTVDRKSVV